ncbi:hypothetical protein [Streptomyces sp. NPDC059970]|uniref:hypothetical protein n=1 Tax=Streptomyces sp. NPDC059970 TaxID=3347019 RepID=UPI0036B1EE5D
MLGVVEQFTEAGVSFHLLLGYSCQVGFDGSEEQVWVCPFEAERAEWVVHVVVFEQCEGLPVVGGRVVVVDVSHGWIVSARGGVVEGVCPIGSGDVEGCQGSGGVAAVFAQAGGDVVVEPPRFK